MHEILGQTRTGQSSSEQRARSGNAELLAIGIEETGDEAMRERWLQPLLDGKMRSAVS